MGCCQELGRLAQQLAGFERQLAEVRHQVSERERELNDVTDDDIAHVAASIDPARDIGVINAELILADLETVGRSLEKAELEFARALDLDPDSLEAKKALNEVGALLGRPEGGRQAALQALEEQYVLRKEQAEADAQEYLHKAQVFMARGRYDPA